MDAAPVVKKKRTKKAVVPAEPLAEFRADHVRPEPKQEHVILHLRALIGGEPAVDGSGDEVLGYQEQSAFNSEPQSYSSEVLPQPDPQAVQEAVIKTVMPNLLMNDMWPMHVNSACFWCAHKFQNVPIGLPVKFKEGKFNTCGCFCSFECAAAFNFNCTDLGQNKWHSFQLLNRLARKLGYSEIVMAPSRFSLKLFGGWMDISEFRASNKTVAALPHPMVSVVQYLEEVIPNDLMKKSTSFVPLDNDRVQKARANILTTTRSKRNTIQTKMNIV